jgi:putative hydrolase of the HAD superfamily
MERRTTKLVAELLEVDPEKARTKRKFYVEKYGSTLKGLMVEHGFSDSEGYFKNNHPTDVETYLRKDRHLFQALSSIPIPKSILTNSAIEHAQRVIDYLELRDIFDNIFDLKFNDLIGKPNTAAYTKPLDFLSKRAEEVLFVDDKVEFLEPFREIGGKILRVCKGNSVEADAENIPHIRNLKELPQYLGYA